MSRKKDNALNSFLNRQNRSEPQPTPTPETPSSPDNSPTKKVGRPKGRRSNPNYTQISALIPLTLYQKVQVELLKERIAKGERNGLDVSGLIEQLLTEWLERRE